MPNDSQPPPTTMKLDPKDVKDLKVCIGRPLSEAEFKALHAAQGTTPVVLGSKKISQ